MKHKFIMMETRSRSVYVAPAGFELRLLPNSRQERTFTAHLTPMHFIEHTPCMYVQCTGQQWAGRQIKAFTSMYKSVHTRQKKGRVIAITQNGDLTVDASTQSSTYIKTLTTKEKFQC
jgi:hypothetical protein